MKVTSGVVLNIFLPVHNRSLVTKAFVEHLWGLIPVGIRARLWVLDDGCTDDTVEQIKSVWEPYSVLKLNGHAYWGGCLNVVRDIAIRLYISEKEAGQSDRNIIMVCNDDIRFNHSSISAGLAELGSTSVVAATHIFLDYDETDPDYFCSASNLPPTYYAFNSSTSRFETVLVPEESNVAPTYALLSFPEAWVNIAPVPAAIPHYLSDYWVTFEMHEAGYALKRPDGFCCVVSQKTTKNRPGCIKKNSFGKTRFFIKYAPPWLSNRLVGYSEFANPLSPVYGPAFIAFNKKNAKVAPAVAARLRVWCLVVLGRAIKAARIA